MNYDIIGDVHGHASELKQLLTELDYQEIGGVWQHEDRIAALAGDFIDRGEEQLEVISIVRPMVQAGTAKACMGNHELNAIAWATPNPDRPGDFMRTHEGEKGQRNRHQHAAFLDAVEHDPRLHQEIIAWFMTLPLWLDLHDIRVVHACWDPAAMQVVAKRLDAPDGRLKKETLITALRDGTPEMRAVEMITKGLELTLPPGVSYFDKDGHERHQSRVRWWDENALTYPELVLLSEAEAAGLPNSVVADLVKPPPSDVPTFFGHYWFSGEPRLLSPTTACVDYSIAREGALVAYRWDGERTLDASKFVSVKPGRKLVMRP